MPHTGKARKSALFRLTRSGHSDCNSDGIILVVARSLPAKIEKSPKPLSELEEQFLNALADGVTAAQLARKMAPDDKAKRKRLRAKFRYLAHKQSVQDAAGQIAKAEAVLGVLPATNALVRKASAGRVDAIKLLYEASGFYNPRTEVNHSGEVQITIKGLPRPTPVVDETISDAEVIED